ncbi:MAG: pilus assembly protein PilP [Deltaproteobacteria bacterium]|nr:pilus assembly protein PilP [Deltaproteobacteria bacterium]
MKGNTASVCISMLLFALFVTLGCGDDEEEFRDFNTKTVRPGQSSVEAKARLARGKSSGLVEKAEQEDQKVGLPQLKETDFIKGNKRRDPFEPFVEMLVKQEDIKKLVQREVKLKEYNVTDLTLIGIITKIGDPRAMVKVPDGTGFVLKRGDFVGRADFVQQGNRGEPIQVNWRVARIHGSGKEEERGVYLVRDDPTTSKGVDITRFLPLHSGAK